MYSTFFKWVFGQIIKKPMTDFIEGEITPYEPLL